MLMKIDPTMESGGSSGEEMTSPNSRGSSLSPMALSMPLSSRCGGGGGGGKPYSPPMDRNSPLGPPTSLAAHHMMNSIAASSAAKNMAPGILASLSALNAMSSAAAAASFHHHDFSGSNSSFVGDRGLDRHPYGSPPASLAPTNDPSANECKLVDYRGQKVAAFVINGETMLCLPQAFELFLKHLVGGLHTVYTKLKRLDIIPIVCNVEQVRILRGLGAIQPGVNRCKLLSCKDFDVLYKDCTTARPGRPPKRTSVPLVPLSHGTPSQFISMKKHRLENGDYPHYDSSHHNRADVMRLEKSPLLANGYNHPPTQIAPMHLLPLAGQSAAAAAAVAAHAALFSPSGLPLPPGHPRDCRSAPIQLDAVAARNATWETCRTAYEDFVKQFESRYHEDCSDSEKSSHANEAGSGEGVFIRNGNLDGTSPVLNLSKNTTETVSDSDENGGDDEEDYSDNERNARKYPTVGRSKLSAEVEDRKSPSEATAVPPHHDSQSSHYAEVSAAEAAISSTENLLRNIQGLLKVAADNAKQQERRVGLERADFKMEIMRERELREQLEKQLVEERNLRIYYEKRWKKERRFRKKLEDTQEDSSESPQHHHHHHHQQQHPLHHHQSHLQQTPSQIQQLTNAEKGIIVSSENAKLLQNSAPSTNGSAKGDGSDR